MNTRQIYEFKQYGTTHYNTPNIKLAQLVKIIYNLKYNYSEATWNEIIHVCRVPHQVELEKFIKGQIY